MSKVLSAKYYSKKDCQKARQRCKNLSEKETEKNVNTGVNDIKISLTMENKGWLSIEKIILKIENKHCDDQNI